MLTDTSLLPGLDDPAPWDDSGGDQEEKRPGVQDLSDEMESDNDTESNANIIAPDDGNINGNSGKNSSAVEEIRATKPINHSLWGARSSARNPVAKATTEPRFDVWAATVAEVQNGEEVEGEEEIENEQPTQSKPDVKQSGKYDDFTQKMIALSAERKRAAANDGWKQHESVPPVGIHEDIKKSDSGIAVREGKEFRQRDDLVIESREITPPEATESAESHEDEQSQRAKVDHYQSSNWYAYERLKAARKIIREKQIKGAILREVLTFIAETSRPERDMWVFNLAQTHMSEIIGQDRKVIGRAINELLRMGLITKIRSAVANKISATYKLNF